MLVLAAACATMILVLWWRRRRRERTVSDPAQSTPDLWAWHMIETIDVRPLSGDRAWIRCRVTRRWGRVPVTKDWVVDIEVPCGAAVREELHRKLWAWRTDAVSSEFN